MRFRYVLPSFCVLSVLLSPAHGGFSHAPEVCEERHLKPNDAADPSKVLIWRDLGNKIYAVTHAGKELLNPYINDNPYSLHYDGAEEELVHNNLPVAVFYKEDGDLKLCTAKKVSFSVATEHNCKKNLVANVGKRAVVFSKDFDGKDIPELNITYTELKGIGTLLYTDPQKREHLITFVEKTGFISVFKARFTKCIDTPVFQESSGKINAKSRAFIMTKFSEDLLAWDGELLVSPKYGPRDDVLYFWSSGFIQRSFEGDKYQILGVTEKSKGDTVLDKDMTLDLIPAMEGISHMKKVILRCPSAVVHFKDGKFSVLAHMNNTIVAQNERMTVILDSKNKKPLVIFKGGKVTYSLGACVEQDDFAVDHADVMEGALDETTFQNFKAKKFGTSPPSVQQYIYCASFLSRRECLMAEKNGKLSRWGTKGVTFHIVEPDGSVCLWVISGQLSRTGKCGDEKAVENLNRIVKTEAATLYLRTGVFAADPSDSALQRKVIIHFEYGYPSYKKFAVFDDKLIVYCTLFKGCIHPSGTPVRAIQNDEMIFRTEKVSFLLVHKQQSMFTAYTMDPAYFIEINEDFSDNTALQYISPTKNYNQLFTSDFVVHITSDVDAMMKNKKEAIYGDKFALMMLTPAEKPGLQVIESQILSIGLDARVMCKAKSYAFSQKFEDEGEFERRKYGGKDLIVHKQTQIVVAFLSNGIVYALDKATTKVGCSVH